MTDGDEDPLLLLSEVARRFSVSDQTVIVDSTTALAGGEGVGAVGSAPATWTGAHRRVRRRRPRPVA